MRPGESPRPATDWFAAPVAAEGARRRSVRGTLVSALGRVSSQAVNLASLMVLARMLTPADFGIIAMVMAVVGVAAIFQDLGLSGAMLRMRDLTHAQAGNLFWINVAAGAAMALLVTAAAPLVETFYRDVDVRYATAVMSVGLLFGGLGTQHTALLRRQMRFGQLAGISTLSVLGSSAVAIGMAFAGQGYWALIAGSLTGSFLSMTLAWLACSWRPGLPRRGVGTGPALRFGLDMLGFGLLAFLARNLHSVIIGRYWGAAAAGFYSRAYNVGPRLYGAVLGPLGLVAPSVMATMVQEPDRFRRYYYSVCALTVMAVMPIIFICLVLPVELIAVVLGDQWSEAARPLMLLAIGMLPQVVAHTTGWVYLSAGSSRAMLRWGLIGWSGMIAATVAGAGFGLDGIALASSAVSFLVLPACLRLAFAGTPLRPRELLLALARPVAAGLLAAPAVVAALQLASASGPFLRLCLGGAGFVAVYALLVLTIFGQRPLIAEVVAELSAARRSRDA